MTSFEAGSGGTDQPAAAGDPDDAAGVQRRRDVAEWLDKHPGQLPASVSGLDQPVRHRIAELQTQFGGEDEMPPQLSEATLRLAMRAPPLYPHGFPESRIAIADRVAFSEEAITRFASFTVTSEGRGYRVQVPDAGTVFITSANGENERGSLTPAPLDPSADPEARALQIEQHRERGEELRGRDHFGKTAVSTGVAVSPGERRRHLTATNSRRHLQQLLERNVIDALDQVFYPGSDLFDPEPDLKPPQVSALERLNRVDQILQAANSCNYIVFCGAANWAEALAALRGSELPATEWRKPTAPWKFFAATSDRIIPENIRKPIKKGDIICSVTGATGEIAGAWVAGKGFQPAEKYSPTASPFDTQEAAKASAAVTDLESALSALSAGFDQIHHGERFDPESAKTIIKTGKILAYTEYPKRSDSRVIQAERERRAPIRDATADLICGYAQQLLLPVCGNRATAQKKLEALLKVVGKGWLAETPQLRYVPYPLPDRYMHKTNIPENADEAIYAVINRARTGYL